MHGGVWGEGWRDEPSAGGGGAGDGGAAGRRPKIQSRPQSGGCFGNRERAPEPTAFCSDAPPRTTARAYLARTNVSLRRLGSTSRSIGASFDAFFDFFTIAAPTGIGTRARPFFNSWLTAKAPRAPGPPPSRDPARRSRPRTSSNRAEPRRRCRARLHTEAGRPRFVCGGGRRRPGSFYPKERRLCGNCSRRETQGPCQTRPMKSRQISPAPDDGGRRRRRAPG